MLTDGPWADYAKTVWRDIPRNMVGAMMEFRDRHPEVRRQVVGECPGRAVGRSAWRLRTNESDRLGRPFVRERAAGQ